MKILILGANGLIGSNIAYSLKRFSVYNVNIVAAIRKHAKENFEKNNIETVIIKDYFKEFRELLSAINPDYVINCVGIVSQNFSKFSKEEVIKWNSLFPHFLHRVSQDMSQRTIHISTDCVFGAGSNDNYESSEKFAKDTYGMSKVLGEITSEYGHTIRLSSVGFEHSSVKHGLFEWFLENQGAAIDGYENAIYSGVSGSEVYRIIDFMIGNWHISKLLHFEGYTISKLELLRLFNDALGGGVCVTAVPQPEVRRNLKSSFVRPADLGLPPWPIQIQNLLNMRKFYGR